MRHSGTPGLTSGAAEAFPLLPPLGIAQDVDDQRGKLAGVEPGQLLAPLRGEEPVAVESECTAQYCRPGRLQLEPAAAGWLLLAANQAAGSKR